MKSDEVFTVRVASPIADLLLSTVCPTSPCTSKILSLGAAQRTRTGPIANVHFSLAEGQHLQPYVGLALSGKTNDMEQLLTAWWN